MSDDVDEGRAGRVDDARLAYEQSSLGQAFLDTAGRFTSVNAALAALLGRPEEWFVGRHALSVLHPLSDPELSGHLRELRSGGVETLSVEVVAEDAEGRSLELMVDVALVHDPDGTSRLVSMIARDVTAVRTAEERLARQERLYRTLSSRVADVAVVTDARLQVIFVSPVIRELVGHDPIDVLSRDLTELVHPDDGQELRRIAGLARRSTHGRERCVVRLETVDGQHRWTEVTIMNLLTDPDVGGLIVNLRDVTREREAERAVRESESRYRTVVETAQEGILTVTGGGQVGLANDRICEILGVTRESMTTSDLVRTLLGGLETGASERNDGVVRHEVRYDHPDGSVRVLSVSSSPLPEEGGGSTLVMVSDVTEAHLLEQRLRHQAMHDQLTGLPNRYLFEDRLEMAAARQQRLHAGRTAVMYVDLDGFKHVNDRHGHATGDLLLQHVAAQLVRVVRTTDTVARLGGDEFAVICEGMDGDAARLVAARIRDEVCRVVQIDGRSIEVAASIGIAVFPPHDPQRALALADNAMYVAKRQGGGGFVLVDGDEDEPRGDS